MNLHYARMLASEVVRQLKPYCERCEIAGSIRRQKPDNIKDIEIVLIPRLVPVETSELFRKLTNLERDKKFVKVINQPQWKIIKGNAKDGKYMKREFIFDPGQYPGIPERSVIIDIFTATSDNWGLQFAIRTGSAEYSHRILAGGWVRAGYKSEGGKLIKEDTGEVLSVPEEKDLFKLIGVPFAEPEKREFA